MPINVAQNAGFCFGVNRAVDTINKLLNDGKKVCTLGSIIHNPQIINSFKKRGVVIVAKPMDVDPKSVLIIRSHGISAQKMKEILSLNIDYIDLTCPFVKKIHNIVNICSNQGKIIFVAGDKTHPEVEGIVGNCSGPYFVFNNSHELLNIINNNDFTNHKISVVVQTTFSVSTWEKCLQLLKNTFQHIEIFDTICSTTQNRQTEAETLSKKSDLMIVVGGKKSSNTLKLKAVCENNCKTYLIETAEDLPIDEIKHAKFIGITAGASTPANIIEEVKQKMSDILERESSVEGGSSFEEMLEESLKNMNTDNKVKGVVVKITPNEIYVDIGRKQAGFIPVSELSTDPHAKVEDLVKVGDTLDLLIMRTNDQDGTIMLSKKRIDAIKGWNEITAAEKDETVLSGIVTDIVKGGIIVVYNGVKVFIPASLATASKSETLEDLKNKEIEFNIIEVKNKPRKRVVGSRRSVLNVQRKQQREKIWENIKIGDEIKGVVRSLTSYGAFVDLGGIDGMIHVSELSWNKTRHPSEILSIGDEISVVIKDLDKENGRISLGYKEKGENPWSILERDYPVGSVVEVTIVGITDFGAFAKIIPGIDGLIHVSQISNDRIKTPKDVLKIGDIVKAKIIDIDLENHRVGLSMKALLEPQEEEN
ncbi:MAG: 4-hydroxy-3-methylbut-2-enyl diphosphate reductase [Eubacteriales bacterium SKADARSKE-1]|nr:4-hydroxy-3-methylbut-2-enyl diphosphate reductase [Eubacteriales bacterium SKADARSKE-1]